MNIKGEVKMLKYDDPRVWKSNAEDVKIEIPSCVNPPLKKIKITQNGEMPIKDMSQYRKYVLSEKEQEKKEENKEEEVMAENKKSSCGKKKKKSCMDSCIFSSNSSSWGGNVCNRYE